MVLSIRVLSIRISVLLAERLVVCGAARSLHGLPVRCRVLLQICETGAHVQTLGGCIDLCKDSTWDFPQDALDP